jgi:hypothetical protein
MLYRYKATKSDTLGYLHAVRLEETNPVACYSGTVSSNLEASVMRKNRTGCERLHAHNTGLLYANAGAFALLLVATLTAAASGQPVWIACSFAAFGTLTALPSLWASAIVRALLDGCPCQPAECGHDQDTGVNPKTPQD